MNNTTDTNTPSSPAIPKPPVVAEICFSTSWGGLEMRVIDEAVQLASRNHTILPIALTDSTIAKEFVAKGFHPETIKSVRDYFDPVAILALAKLFRENKVQAVHLHRTQDLGVVVAAAAWAKVPTRVFTLRMESSRRKRDLYHRWAYDKLTALLTITDNMRNLVLANVAVDPQKVITLFDGIDWERMRSQAESRKAIRARWSVPEDSFVVGLLGRIDPLKGQRLLLDAANRLKPVIPNLFIVIAGEETFGEHGETDYLNSQIKEFAITDRVRFTGYINHPEKILPAFDVSVMPSKKETFGQVVVESMALEIPTIATNAGGVPEIITHRQNGMLFEPDNAVELANAIEFLYTHPDQRAQFAREGLRTVQEKFSLERHNREMEKILGLVSSK